VKEQLADPQLFTAEQLTVVVPTAKVLPDTGVQVTDGEVPVVVGAKLTLWPQVPVALFVMMLAGHVIVGGVHAA